MVDLHVILPFSRMNMKHVMLNMYESNKVILHPITYTSEFNSSYWVVPLVVDPSEMGDGAEPYHKINKFISEGPIIDGDMYGVMCDDDRVEKWVCDAIRPIKEDVVFISMKRGDHVPEGLPPHQRHPINTLTAHPHLVMPCHIGLEQIWVRGRVLRSMKYLEDNIYADGVMAMALKECLPVRYEPDLFIKFNYYEVGRWDDASKKRSTA